MHVAQPCHCLHPTLHGAACGSSLRCLWQQDELPASPPTCPGAEVVIEAHRLWGGDIAELRALAAHHQRHHLQACNGEGSRGPARLPHSHCVRG